MVVMLDYGTDYTCEHGEQLGECGDPQCWRAEEPPAEPSYLDTLRAALVDTYGLDQLPKPIPIVAGMLYADSLNWLVGKPGSMKSFVALDIAGCVATGETWQGWPVARGPVLYVIAEGVTGLTQRVRAWEQAYGRRMDGVHFLPVAPQAKNGGEWDALVALAADLKPAFVAVDTQARVTRSMDENSALDMGEFVGRLDALRVATRACLLAVHHQGRNGEHMRGSTALEGAATTIMRTEKDGSTVTIRCDKQKDGADFTPVTLRAVEMGESVVLAVTDKAGEPLARMTWLDTWRDMFADEWVSVAVLVRNEVVAERTFNNNRLRLINEGVIEKSGEKAATRYRLVSP